MKCDKKGFINIDDAKQRLNEILSTSNENEKPIRIYKCEFCSKYHLTSKTYKEYLKNKNRKRMRIKKRNEKRENHFIYHESEHWESYFGIDY